MNMTFNIAFVIVLGLVALCGVWFCYPQTMPRTLRDNIPGFELPSPRSPMTNFRPPQF